MDGKTEQLRVRVPRWVLAYVDATAKKLGVSRGDVISDVLKAWAQPQGIQPVAARTTR